MYPHRIRLRGPWDVVGPQGETRPVKFPIRWDELLDERRGLSPPNSAPSAAATSPTGTSPAARQAIARRPFGAPSGIDAHERVWLIGEGLAGPVHLSLNDRDLGEFDETTFGVDVTRILGQRNLLEMRLGPARRDVNSRSMSPSRSGRRRGWSRCGL